MIFALLVSLTAPALQSDEPPVRVQLSDERFRRGDRARVYVETERDGYLVVLHADPDGRVRVLFPLDPTDDDFVRGGRRAEIRGRGDRDAFFVDAREGAGTVLAALASDPYGYGPFVRGDHWDYRVLGPVGDDPLAGLLDIVQRMAGEARFEYDVAGYVVGRPVASGSGYHGSSYGLHFGFSYGYPFRYRYFYPYRPYLYSPFYDPFCYDPLWGLSAFCFRYGFAYSTIYFSSPYVFRRSFVRDGFFDRSRTVRSGFVIPRDRVRVTSVEPRRRPAVLGRDREPARREILARDREQRGRGLVPVRWRDERGGRGRAVVPRGVERGRASPMRPAPRGGREVRPSNGGTRRPVMSRGSSRASRGSVRASRPSTRASGSRRRP